MKKLFLFFCWSFLFLTAFPQVNTDSLWSIWNDTSQRDTNRLVAMERLLSVITNSYPDSAMGMIDDFHELAVKGNHSFYIAEARFKRSIVHAVQGNFVQSMEENQKALEIALRDSVEGRIAAYRNGLGATYSDLGMYFEAIREFEKAQVLHVKDEDSLGVAIVLGNIAINYNILGDGKGAMAKFNESLEISTQIGDIEGIAFCKKSLGEIYFGQGDNEKARSIWLESAAISEELEDGQFLMETYFLIGQTFDTNLDSARYYYNKAGDIADQLNSLYGLAMLEDSYAEMLLKKGDISGAIERLNKAMELHEASGSRISIVQCLSLMSEAYFKQNNFTKAAGAGKEAVDLATEIGSIKDISAAAEKLSMIYEETGQGIKALEMYRLHIQMRDSLKNEEIKRAILRQEFETQAMTDSLEFAKREAIKDLEIEYYTDNISRQRIALISAGVGLLIIIGLAFAIFKGKKRSDELLLNILPAETARELKANGSAETKMMQEVTVIFTDFQGFTSISEALTPKQLVQDLNECFSAFDQIMEKYGVEKIKTIGDAYMAAGGLPVPNSTHAIDTVNAALDIQQFMEKLKEKKSAAGLPCFDIRIGVHTGPVVAGIVGIKKFQYDIWGDTVNTAARMESSAEIGKVNISEATYQLVKKESDMEFKSRGKIEAKGKGLMEMFYVNRIG